MRQVYYERVVPACFEPLIELQRWGQQEAQWRLGTVQRSILPNPFIRERYNVHVEVVDQHQRHCYIGYAQGNHYHATAFRAFAEAFERYVFRTRASDWETSNGFAAHTDFLKAVCAGAVEMIERDAVLDSWSAQRAPQARVHVAEISARHRCLQRYGFEADLFLMRSQWIMGELFPVVLCVIRPVPRPLWARCCWPNRFAGRIVGIGCAGSLLHAAQKAYREATMNAWAIFRQAPVGDSDETPGDAHLAFYLDAQHVEAFDVFERQHVPTIACDDRPAVSDNLWDRLLDFLTVNQLRPRVLLYAERGETDPFFVVKIDISEFRQLSFRPEIMQPCAGSHRHDWPHPIP